MASARSPRDDKLADDLLEYINDSDTQFHAVEQAKARLDAAGYMRLSERQSWDGLRPGGRYYFTRNDSTLVAFAVGARYEPGNGFYILGAHTDSPCFKLKPVSKCTKSGYAMVNVEPYGGLLQHTWFDRDLSVAGRVLIRTEEGSMQHKLVKVPEPILRIPMLAIHLQRDINSTGFNPNKQTECTPLLALQAALQDSEGPAVSEGRHHPWLLHILAKELGVRPEDIVDFDLNVIDTQAGVIGGAEGAFVFVGRLDNLCSSYLGLRALLDSDVSLASEAGVRVLALFDNEEVGSASAQGAAGPVLQDTIARVAAVLGGGAEGAVQRALQASFLLSADMAHALHPNYPDRHDAAHAPRLGDGIVLKHNANQRYATTAVSATLFREVCRQAGVPTADFAVRSDMGCGSTIGPILASGLGLRTVDVGLPQLSMHSIREMCAVADVGHGYRAFLAFYQTVSALDAALEGANAGPA
ncbi:Aspartyl aminopeptidase [Auxenochlorella protothecoides]|uniref:aspartyl aminopeptidase n=2 Tax=Auxenochlorella protothecoides TaxID=3075 RepID=A0A087SDY9_AUXPR|nr:Aspartyl aminopeptidase [Auxenochlorella protothecoides]KFM23943.1 Aspartyl aminopeptidase [Auxenochlorella protothecoides]